MVSIAQVGVLPAHPRAQHGELGVNECADEGDDAADQPCAQHQHGCVHLPRDDGWINEDTGADDAAHDDHGGVEGAEASRERGFLFGGVQFPSPPN
jgi:hypothetical protein